jgi:ribosomal protein L24
MPHRMLKQDEIDRLWEDETGGVYVENPFVVGEDVVVQRGAHKGTIREILSMSECKAKVGLKVLHQDGTVRYTVVHIWLLSLEMSDEEKGPGDGWEPKVLVNITAGRHKGRRGTITRVKPQSVYVILVGYRRCEFLVRKTSLEVRTEPLRPVVVEASKSPRTPTVRRTLIRED